MSENFTYKKRSWFRKHLKLTIIGIFLLGLIFFGLYWGMIKSDESKDIVSNTTNTEKSINETSVKLSNPSDVFQEVMELVCCNKLVNPERFDAFIKNNEGNVFTIQTIRNSFVSEFKKSIPSNTVKYTILSFNNYRNVKGVYYTSIEYEFLNKKEVKSYFIAFDSELKISSFREDKQAGVRWPR